MPHTPQGDLDDAIASRAEELAELLSTTVRIPSVTGSERAIADWYAEWMIRHGWELELQPLDGTVFASGEETVGDRANLIGYPFGRPGPGTPVLVLNGHIDVVPTGREELWATVPFSGARAGGRVFGRGTVDMKGGIAAALIALDTLRNSEVVLPMVPVIHLVIGEETTGVGTRLALATERAPDAAIILEPTNNTIITACTGLQFFRVTARGRAAHSSAPWRGVDALARLLVLRDALIQTAARRSAAFAHPRFADVPTGIPFTIGMLEAGTYRAAVPDVATLTGRIGLRPGEDPDHARAEFAAALRAAVVADPFETEMPHELEWQGEPYPGWDTEENESLVVALRDALVMAQGSPEFGGFTAGNDAGQYAQAGAVTIVFGPGDAALAHTVEESISEADVLLATRTIVQTLVSLS
ncbi:Acetylornithine deacetylase [Leucobacter sp. 7(1)]|uniref:M20 family metallopeptidase n=1 Tax=Leucobacter sp. 7(1) TaxID=1255613 RepID=UPI00097F3E35|nr:ArgE/DapE family deacylase [Leucobacter sp. 7(1)]SJN09128.1 Acetylornithine deacetylase [Leucobacter sp. 7(1)]